MSVIETLTEGIRARSLANEGEALLGKWEKTGLLEGLDDVGRTNMSRLLENQAAQLLKETSLMSSGDVEGFASVAFPIVRRVFGNLLAQDLVSVQPMSLPSGLIFFLDFKFSAEGSSMPRLAQEQNTSVYGGGVLGQQITGGVDLANELSEKSFYSLNQGYASPTGSNEGGAGNLSVYASGTYGDTATSPGGHLYDVLRSDPLFTSGAAGVGTAYAVATHPLSDLNQSDSKLNLDDLIAITPGSNAGGLIGGNLSANAMFVRRLTQFSGSSTTTLLFVGADNGVNQNPDPTAPDDLETAMQAIGNGAGDITYPMRDTFNAVGSQVGAIVGAQNWGLENEANLPEIDIDVSSVAVTALTKKLKAKWSPELAQDLNAYHNLDAEVELTSILSEQVALEIDREILNDLVQGATAATLYWSRRPGKFVDRDNGTVITGTNFPDFTGTVSEWYETLLETINEVSARIHRKTLRGGANFLVCSPEVANILEFTSGFRASTAVDDDKGSWGVQKVGSISRKMDIHVDPYFLRNVVLVGRRGSSFLESGYVYAPYVPLQVTPTIFGPEDFVPRKGVMTRYAKQMVRPDMYGLVIVADLVG